MQQNRFFSHLESQNFLGGGPRNPLTKGVSAPSRCLPQLVPSALDETRGVQWPYHFLKADDGPGRLTKTIIGRNVLNLILASNCFYGKTHESVSLHLKGCSSSAATSFGVNLHLCLKVVEFLNVANMFITLYAKAPAWRFHCVGRPTELLKSVNPDICRR